MSFDFKKSVKKGAKITPKKIRSKYRLRLMNRLVESQETVSELAKSVGLRMPHASAEIKRMRDEKLVSSDLEIGSRGAKIRLTEEGIKVLQMDEWYKAEEALPSFNLSSARWLCASAAGIRAVTAALPCCCWLLIFKLSPRRTKRRYCSGI